MKKRANSNKKTEKKEKNKNYSKELSKIKLEIKKEKKKAIEEDEEETLEQHIDDSEIIENSEFREFVNTPANRASPPVLERIENKDINLEENVASSPRVQEERETGINYSARTSQMNYSGNTNYAETNKGYEETPVRPPVLEPMRRENVQRQEMLNWSDLRAGAREHTSWTEETKMVETRNVERRKHELPFEKEEKKYKEFRR